MGLTNEQKSDVIRKFLSSSDGRNRLSASMIAPLRERRDYNNFLNSYLHVPGLEPETEPEPVLPSVESSLGPDFVDVIAFEPEEF